MGLDGGCAISNPDAPAATGTTEASQARAQHPLIAYRARYLGRLAAEHGCPLHEVERALQDGYLDGLDDGGRADAEAHANPPGEAAAAFDGAGLGHRPMAEDLCVFCGRFWVQDGSSFCSDGCRDRSRQAVAVGIGG